MGEARQLSGLLEYIEMGGEPTIYCHHVTYEPDGGNVVCRVWHRKHNTNVMVLQALVVMKADDLAVSARAAKHAAADAHNMVAFRLEFDGKAN